MSSNTVLTSRPSGNSSTPRATSNAGIYDGGSEPLAVEKWLEHFVSIDLIRPKADDICLDVASCSSPFVDILRDAGVRRAYRHDWCFPPGTYPHGLASDVASLPLRERSVDALTLHCSFEHFEGDRDSCFVRESDRILKPAGRCLSGRRVGPGSWTFLRSRPFRGAYPQTFGKASLDLYRVANYQDVAPDCYLKFAAVFTRT
jgi:hypothetical protein